MHLVRRSTVPPVLSRAFNHLVGQRLDMRRESDLVVVEAYPFIELYPESFERTAKEGLPLVQIRFEKEAHLSIFPAWEDA